MYYLMHIRKGLGMNMSIWLRILLGNLFLISKMKRDLNLLRGLKLALQLILEIGNTCQNL
jgi:hypothetical protein